MTVFYFTATGNSLYVAKRLGGKLVSIPQGLEAGEADYSDDVIGVVCPCYMGGIPRIVKRFLEKVKLRAEYMFAIVTYGNAQTSALDQMNKLGAAQGVRFNYMNAVLMVDNYLPMFKIEEELANAPQKGIEGAITAIMKDVRDRKQHIPPTGFANKVWGAVFRSGAKKIIGENADHRFTVDHACTLCGVCAKVCPVNNISLNNDPVFGDQCEGCLACTHHCPVGAIHVKGERSATRFRNEHIGLDEVIAANERHIGRTFTP